MQQQPSPYTAPPPVVSLDKVEKMRRGIAHLFLVGDTTLDEPHKGFVRYRGRFLVESADCFDEIREIFEAQGFTPTVREEENGRIAIVAIPQVFNPPASDWRINLALFIVTVLATLLTGSMNSAETQEQAFQIWRGWPFSLSIMLILGAHELGHYFAARHHKVAVTLPYFIPLPLFSLFGTLGAFIRMKEPVKNKRALFDIGVAGPLAGLVFAVPILLYGLVTSETGPISSTGLLEGNSIFYYLSKFVIFGQFLPSETSDVYLNQVAWAGWLGLLITALNLTPLGQLDGGHIMFSLFGKRAGQLFTPVIVTLIALTLASFLIYGTATWALWILLLFFLGRTHAEPLDDVTPLDPRRRWLGIATMVIFVLIFTPVPLRFLG
ncbi:site-2 protease family protein [Candidatus Leptofilum sp.]|uniref:site-2 protease family protein n=1 Tax=Candidatus Leptofilum sp. TaxID=3241576 RepID=UPI003B5ABFCA